MINPGIYSLGDFAITTAGTASPVTVVDLDGMTAVTINARFQYGAGGSQASVIVQTSLDQGLTWIDVARFDFVTSSRNAVANLSGLTAKDATAVASLSSEGVTDGVLGDRLQAYVVSSGTYSGSTLASVRVSAR